MKSDKITGRNKIISIKDNRLHIYKRTNSNFFQGRMFLNGNQIVKSSGTSNIIVAKKTLGKWFEEQHFKVKHNISIRNTKVKDAVDRFLIWNDETNSITKTTRKGYKDQFSVIKKFKILMNQNLNLVTSKEIELFIAWRMMKAKLQSKVLRGATLIANLTALSKFFNWCVQEGLLEKKHRSLTNIKKLLDSKLRGQITSRAGFTKTEYQLLLKFNRMRIKQGRSIRDRFRAEQLHQFIIFMVGTGMRVDECLNLKWDDVNMIDREKTEGKKFLHDDLRYCLEIYCRVSKTKQRRLDGLSSSYYAFQRLIKLYQDTGMRKVFAEDETIWGVKSFREGMNSLLNYANLKTKKVGGRFVKMDSKSLRNTYIQFMIDKKISYHYIADNCGTSIQMIEKNYTANSTIEGILDTILMTGRVKLKAV
tara:strand:- start:810 stop:2069 length:1260 start_codon:yes stop_codon:yes gene_type:complete